MNGHVFGALSRSRDRTKQEARYAPVDRTNVLTGKNRTDG